MSTSDTPRTDETEEYLKDRPYPDTIIHLARELERENAVLRHALEALCDEQNGPPLERRSTEWNAAYEQARAALARKEAQL